MAIQTAEVGKITKLIGEKIENLFQAKIRGKTTKIDPYMAKIFPHYFFC